MPSVVLVAVATDESRADSDADAAAACCGPGPRWQVVRKKYGRRDRRYAERRGILFGGDGAGLRQGHPLGDQHAADAAVWTPRFEDLRPQLISKEQTR